MKKSLVHALVLIVTAFFASSTQAQSAHTKNLATTLDNYLSRNEVFGMSGAVLVAKDGEIVLQKGYGEANYSSHAKISPESPFIIGSLSKQFTAAAILKLESEGKLSTSDAVSKFFPDAPKRIAGITIHQLLTHTAGLPYLPEQDLLGDISREQAVREALEVPVDQTKIGTYAYSSPGYSLLSAVIEKASGESFNHYLGQHLFIPAGMSNTGFMGETERFKSANAVHSYSGGRDEGAITDFPVAPRAMGAGTIISTVGDLHKWVNALHTNVVLPEAEVNKLFTPYVEENARTKSGYGWNIVNTIRNTRVITHGGDFGGYNAEIRMYADEGLTVIFLSNARPEGLGYRDAVMNNLSLLTFGGPAVTPPEVVASNPKELKQFTGRYALATGGELFAWMEDDKLLVGSDAQAGISLLANNDSNARAMQSSISSESNKILTELRAGKTNLLQEDLHPSLPFESSKQEFLNALEDDKLGKLKDVEILGTALLSPVMAKTFFRTVFADGSTLHSYTWVGGKIMSSSAGFAHAMPIQVAKVSATELASFDPFSGKSIRFDLSDGGKSLKIESGEISVRATKES